MNEREITHDLLNKLNVGQRSTYTVSQIIVGLNDIIVDQQKEINELNREIENLKKEVTELNLNLRVYTHFDLFG